MLLLAAPAPSLVPKPVSVAMAADAPGFAFDRATRVRTDARAAGTGRMLAGWLHLPRPARFDAGATKSILVRVEPGLKARDGKAIPAEGYRLSVGADRIEIRGADVAGAFYGAQTLRQLLPTEMYARTGKPLTATVPAMEIEDWPRFGWRGLHLDVGRHFMPKARILEFLDAMALHKLNTFHWHLTEDQGWRIEIKRYPKLTKIGAYRADDMLKYDPPTYSGKPHGGFYTQAEVREVVRYAAARHITVVPEIEMPGHASAAIAAYPELGNTGKTIPVETKYGVFEDIFNPEDSTIRFLQNVLTEVLALFPSRFIHVGGDEAPKKQWRESARAQAKIKAIGLKDEHELQSWFVRQMDVWLAARGRRLIGWDEILEGGLAPGATVMSWRGTEGGIAAAKAGHDVVMASNSHLYFDYYQSKDREKEPHAIGGFVPLELVYAFEPTAGLDADAARHVLGAQAQHWTEYIRDMDHLEYMAFPRAAALSEVVWSPAGPRDFAEFRARLAGHLPRLGAMGVRFRPLD